MIYRAHHSFHRQITDRFLTGMALAQVDIIEHSLLNLQTFLQIADEKGDSNEND
ncbi:hypothetical protein [Oenococcus oeni]|uniref:hypothetical protein n=1 Tax=Oenococcus oeni TaxID=1247 RepID=UPI000B1C89A0|nr:hypothetical protein [Oenococcus oeni]